jgi:hypothetical protein
MSQCKSSLPCIYIIIPSGLHRPRTHSPHLPSRSAKPTPARSIAGSPGEPHCKKVHPRIHYYLLHRVGSSNPAPLMPNKYALGVTAKYESTYTLQVCYLPS